MRAHACTSSHPDLHRNRLFMQAQRAYPRTRARSSAPSPFSTTAIRCRRARKASPLPWLPSTDACLPAPACSSASSRASSFCTRACTSAASFAPRPPAIVSPGAQVAQRTAAEHSVRQCHRLGCCRRCPCRPLSHATAGTHSCSSSVFSLQTAFAAVAL